MKIEIIEKNIVYQGHLRLVKYALRHQLFSGGVSEVLLREMVEAHHAVGVLLFDPLRDEIVLVEQFRLGVMSQKNPWLLELVAGIIEPNESVEEVAIRESQEESGCAISDLIPIYEYWTSPGMSTGKFSLFCARVDASSAGGIFGLSHEHEDIKAHVFPKQKVYDFLETGEINNAATIIAVQWLKINEKEVKKKWQ